MPASNPETVRINDQEYKFSDLSDDAKMQLTNLRACDAEMARLKAQLAITETARSAYMHALVISLPNNTN
jgi:hypothetical protein